MKAKITVNCEVSLVEKAKARRYNFSAILENALKERLDEETKDDATSYIADWETNAAKERALLETKERQERETMILEKDIAELEAFNTAEGGEHYGKLNEIIANKQKKLNETRAAKDV